MSNFFISLENYRCQERNWPSTCRNLHRCTCVAWLSFCVARLPIAAQCPQLPPTLCQIIVGPLPELQILASVDRSWRTCVRRSWSWRAGWFVKINRSASCASTMRHRKTRAQSYAESWLHWRRPPESWKPSSIKASTYGAWRTSHSTCAAKKPVNPLSSIARLSTLAGRGTNSAYDCICKLPAPLAVPTTSHFSCTLCRVSLTASSPGPCRAQSGWQCWTRSMGSITWKWWKPSRTCRLSRGPLCFATPRVSATSLSCTYRLCGSVAFWKMTCCWCAARSHHESTLASGGKGSNLGGQNLHFEFLHRSCILKFSKTLCWYKNVARPEIS